MIFDCSSPDQLDRLMWSLCYLSNGKHITFYYSILKVLVLLALAAPISIGLGLFLAILAKSDISPLKLLGKFIILIVRGIPDIAWFMFFVIALDQGLEWVRHITLCPDWTEPIRQGADFLVCEKAKLPGNSSSETIHEIYGFILAIITFSIIFGAFAGNIFSGALEAVPKDQIETAEAYGLNPRQIFWRISFKQMWIYALPGLSNLWMILIKATPLLFLLGIEDIVYWARELGGAKTPRFTEYPHGDWRLWYFLFLLIFYLTLTKLSEKVLDKLTRKLTHGMGFSGENFLQRQ